MVDGEKRVKLQWKAMGRPLKLIKGGGGQGGRGEREEGERGGGKRERGDGGGRRD